MTEGGASVWNPDRSRGGGASFDSGRGFQRKGVACVDCPPGDGAYDDKRRFLRSDGDISKAERPEGRTTSDRRRGLS